ncbi:MAG: hypothetical protein NZ961_00625, partial [Candidatus Poribacteria bacterium]|nr:hypothetical protein [Candidatus Poribacteria bacterium]
ISEAQCFQEQAELVQVSMTFTIPPNNIYLRKSLPRRRTSFPFSVCRKNLNLMGHHPSHQFTSRYYYRLITIRSTNSVPSKSINPVISTPILSLIALIHQHN